MSSKLETELENLQARIKALEAIEQEYQAVKNLVDYAAAGHNLEKYAGEIIFYLEPLTEQISSATEQALDFLGYSLEELLSLHISDLEIAESQGAVNVYKDTNDRIYVYTCDYRHQSGKKLAVEVQKRPVNKAGEILVQYALDDKSLRKQVWRELSRREDSEHQFREKLKILNEINIELGRSQSFDELCYRSVELAINRLDFDRLSLWFLGPAPLTMYGSFGVHESDGSIRDERGQTWKFGKNVINAFIEGKKEPLITYDNAPLYNEKSETVGYGWHMSVPLLDGEKFVGFMGVDNLFRHLPLQNYQIELLRLFGVTLGHLVARQREQETIRKFSSAIQQSASMIIVLNRQRQIEFVNASFSQVTAYDLEELRGQDIAFLFPSADFESIWELVLANGDWRGKRSSYKKNGETYQTLLSISTIRTGESIENFVIVQEDITALEQAEQKEIELLLEQEHILMLESFVRDMGHEFKTPLSIIRTSNYILRKSPDLEKRQAQFDKIDEQVTYLNQMLDEILEIVRLDTNMEIMAMPLKLNSFLQGLGDSFSKLIASKQMNWQLELGEDLLIEADAPKFLRALHELVKNALQFTPEHGSVKVFTKTTANKLSIIVEDTGIGIAAEELENIFKRFYRVDKARSSRNTGLGLSIAKIIIEAHQGEILVESVLGHGSRFEIRLPISQRG